MTDKKHVFFNENADEANRYGKIKNSMPEAFASRERETAIIKKDFLKRAQSLKLGQKYSGEHLVLNIFGLRFEEGLTELLSGYTKFEKDGNDFVFTHIDPLET